MISPTGKQEARWGADAVPEQLDALRGRGVSLNLASLEYDWEYWRRPSQRRRRYPRPLLWMTAAGEPGM